MATPPSFLPPVRVTGTPAAACRAVARVAVQGATPKAPVVEAARPVLRRPEPAAPVMRTPNAPVDESEVKTMTLADLAKLLDQRKRGVQEVVLDDSTDGELEDLRAPIVLSQGSQASLAARMLRRR